MKSTSTFLSSLDRSPSAKRSLTFALFLFLTTILVLWLEFSGGSEAFPVNRISVGATAVFSACLFVILSSAFSPALCFFLITTPIIALHYASREKQFHTGEPLIFGDISHVNNMSIALRYLDFSFINIAVFVVAALLVFYLAINARISRRRLLLAPFALSMAVAAVMAGVSTFSRYGTSLGVNYLSWDWPANARENGLLIHLAQTSARPTPQLLTDAQRARFQDYEKAAVAQLGDAPPVFIEVLCEACWYNDALFRESFAPLLDMDAVEMRGISPIFGGGTVNASFEMLTGMPTSNAAVAGIVYQEYRDFFADQASSLPSHLARSGVETLSAHNFESRFWFRNVVEPKLGFMNFYGIEDMNRPEESADSFPRDSILFDFTLDKIASSDTRPAFVQLATVHTHGPYMSEDDDGGRKHYLRGIETSVGDIAAFIAEVRTKYPDAVVLLYGDHKPSLEALGELRGNDRHSTGDVPVLLFDPDRKRAQAMYEKLNEKPFYCYATGVARIYYGMDLPIGHFTDKACQTYSAEQYEELGRSVPAWVYSAALFDKSR